jgi:tyrosine ammonia-lyase
VRRLRYATPASIQSLPTNGHDQDVVPFGTQAALEALRQAERPALSG